jgi:hypothetical protein
MQLAWVTIIRHSSRNLCYFRQSKKKKRNAKKEKNGDRREETKKGKLIKTERKKGLHKVKCAEVQRKIMKETVIRATC